MSFVCTSRDGEPHLDDNFKNNMEMSVRRSCSQVNIDLHVDLLEYLCHWVFSEKNNLKLTELRSDIETTSFFIIKLVDTCRVGNRRTSTSNYNDNFNYDSLLSPPKKMPKDMIWLNSGRVKSRILLSALYCDVIILKGTMAKPNTGSNADVSMNNKPPSSDWLEIEKNLEEAYNEVVLNSNSNYFYHPIDTVKFDNTNSKLQVMNLESGINRSNDILTENGSNNVNYQQDYQNIKQALQVLYTLTKLQEDLFPLLSQDVVSLANNRNVLIDNAFKSYTESLKEIFSRNNPSFSESNRGKMQAVAINASPYNLLSREESNIHREDLDNSGIPKVLLSFIFTDAEKSSISLYTSTSVERVIKHVDQILLNMPSLSQSPSILQDPGETTYSIGYMQEMVRTTLLRWSSTLLDTPKLVALGYNVSRETPRHNERPVDGTVSENDKKIIANAYSGSDTEDPDDESAMKASKTTVTSNLRSTPNSSHSNKQTQSNTSKMRSESLSSRKRTKASETAGKHDDALSFDSENMDQEETSTPRVVRRGRLNDLMTKRKMSGGMSQENDGTYSPQNAEKNIQNVATVNSTDRLSRRSLLIANASSKTKKKCNLATHQDSSTRSKKRQLFQDGETNAYEIDIESDINDGDNSYHEKKDFRVKVPYTEEEENAIREGVLHHGIGNWAIIQKGDERLCNRTKVQIKDKYRTMRQKNQI